MSRTLAASLAVVLLLATFGSFAAGFGTMTACTNTYSCTSTGCAPCATAEAWLTGGWIGQGVLLLTGLVLVVLRRRRARLVRLGAILLGPLSLGLFAATTALAVASY
ncbi:hypothetical protein ACI78T_07415 [Blastococcus sp. SYSU D00922]